VIMMLWEDVRAVQPRQAEKPKKVLYKGFNDPPRTQAVVALL
jgi:hypothetical protein